MSSHSRIVSPSTLHILHGYEHEVKASPLQPTVTKSVPVLKRPLHLHPEKVVNLDPSLSEYVEVRSLHW